ncbi:hypothetical protein NW760_013308 [Fusarium oxysporum]|nr:hypothetical protein NW758_008380 [Fusarium oxysporum]KAJ4052723.1 hypothetical protein NW753_006912 [Fusarium oxysporum]KAJ4217303.1 hypothetical protein NW760_013308 [Fusarium oxysporum]
MPASTRIGSKLEFVSVSHPDEVKNRHNKRKIHQHVMKDIGLSRRKNTRSRKLRTEPDISKTLALHETHPAYTFYQPDNCRPEVSESSMQLLEPGADRTLYSRTDTRAKMMEAFLLRPKSSICDKVREMCFAIGLVDQATLNLALAETALYSNEYTGDMHPGREDSTALKHYNLSLHFTNQRIQTSNSVPSDEILITVIGLANYDMRIGKVERYSTHLAGLETLVRGRGGVDRFRSSYLLLSLIWSDVIGSLSLDRPPRFAAPSHLWTQLEQPTITHVLAKTLKALRDLSPVLSDLCSVLLSLTRVAKASQHWEESTFRYCETILHSSYFLLLVPRHTPSEGPEGHSSRISQIHQVVRLAALRFLVTAAEHSHHTVGAIQYRKPQLSHLLTGYEISWDGLEELQVWVQVIAAVTEGTRDRSWMTERIALTIERLGLNWMELEGMLRQIAWVDSFEGQFSRLEEAVNSQEIARVG